MTCRLSGQCQPSSLVAWAIMSSRRRVALIRTFASEQAENSGELPNGDTSLFRLSDQRGIRAVVQHHDPRAVDPVVFEFQNRAVEEFGRHLLDGKSDGLGGRGKTAIADRAPAMPAAGRK